MNTFDEKTWLAGIIAAHPEAQRAFENLVELAETRNTGQIEIVASFIAATYNGVFHFDLFRLRSVDKAISDDMLTCLDFLRLGRCSLYELILNGAERVNAVMDKFEVRRRPERPSTHRPGF